MEVWIKIGTAISCTAGVLGVLAQILSGLSAMKRGQLCLLRSQLLQIYYRCQRARTIDRYEKESFLDLYEAYRALGGNGFLEDVCREVRTWTVTPAKTTQ